MRRLIGSGIFSNHPEPTLQCFSTFTDRHLLCQVEDNALVERVTGRRLDPQTGKIYHIKHSPAPKDIEHRLVQRSDDNEDALRSRLATHHKNVTDVLSHYADVVSEVSHCWQCWQSCCWWQCLQDIQRSDAGGAKAYKQAICNWRL